MFLPEDPQLWSLCPGGLEVSPWFYSTLAGSLHFISLISLSPELIVLLPGVMFVHKCAKDHDYDDNDYDGDEDDGDDDDGVSD